MRRLSKKVSDSKSGLLFIAKGAVLLALASLIIQPVFASDPTVLKAFAEAEKYAKQQKSFAPDQNELEDKQCRENIRHLEEITGRLTPPQLFELIVLSDKKTDEEFRHPEAYLRYYEQLVAFSIRRLGEIPTAQASQYLDKMLKIVGKHAYLSLVWDEAKEKQQKLMQLRQR